MFFVFFLCGFHIVEFWNKYQHCPAVPEEMEKDWSEDEEMFVFRKDIVLYQTADGKTDINVKLDNDTVWLTQDQLVLLFERDKSVISRHIKNIFREGELDPKVVIAFFATTTLEFTLGHSAK